MPLKQTKSLMDKYGKKLQDGTISDDEIRELLSEKAFTASPGYRDTNLPVSESNHTAFEAMQEFVVALGADMDPAAFHQQTKRMIDLAPVTGGNGFMRGNTLDKAFLAYEYARYGRQVGEHFEENSRIRRELAPPQIQKLVGNIQVLISTLNEKIESFAKQTTNPPTNLDEAWAAAEKEGFNSDVLKALHEDPEPAPEKVSKVDQFKDDVKKMFKEFKTELQDLKAKIQGKPTHAEKVARDDMEITRWGNADEGGKKEVDFKNTPLDDNYVENLEEEGPKVD
ncbi:MAG: hypothetical protein EPN84_11120, partial [Legionella sp.]